MQIPDVCAFKHMKNYSFIAFILNVYFKAFHRRCHKFSS